jgi:hypothetical protein
VRVSVIPDLDDEVCHDLGQDEELLLTLAGWEEDRAEPAVLPAPVAGRVALDALGRVQDVIGPTPTRAGRPAPAGRLLGPDGRYEHRPLRLVALDPRDLDVLTAADAALGLELALNPHGELGEAMAAGAEAAADPYGPPPQPVDLVQALARVLGLLDLAQTEDTSRLAALVAAAGDSDLVLDATGEAAYRRAVTRFTDMWSPRNSLDRFLSSTDGRGNSWLI